MNLSFITADLLNEVGWFDGIIYIILGLIVYAVIRYINKTLVSYLNISNCNVNPDIISSSTDTDIQINSNVKNNTKIHYIETILESHYVWQIISLILLIILVLYCIYKETCLSRWLNIGGRIKKCFFDNDIPRLQKTPIHRSIPVAKPALTIQKVKKVEMTVIPNKLSNKKEFKEEIAVMPS